MKRIILFLPLLLSFHILQAQIFEHLEDRGYKNTYTDVLNVGDTMWVVTGNFNVINSFFSGAYIKALDLSGNELWEYNTPQNIEARRFKELKQMPNGNLLVVGTEQWCCDCSTPYLQVHQFSPQGELLLESTYPGVEFHGEISLTCAENSFAVGFANQYVDLDIFSSNYSGDSLWTKDFNGSEALKMATLEDNIFAFTTEKLYQLSANGAFLDSVEYGSAPLEVLQLENKVLVMSEDGILELLPDLSLTEAFNFAEEGTPPQFLTKYEDNIYQWYDGTIYKYNLNYTLLEEVIYDPLPYFSKNEAAASESSYVLVGARSFQNVGSYPNTNYRGAAIQSFSLEGEVVQHNPDVGLSNVDLEVVNVNQVSQDPPVYHVQTLASGYLVNYGDVVVNEAYINSYVMGICNMGGAHEPINNLNLSPGDSAYFSAYAASDFVVDNDSISRCIFVSEPSHYYDINELNDFACESTLFLGIEEEINPGITSIFPNPASDQVTFSFSKRKKSETLVIHNMQGDLVRKLSIENRESMQLDVSNLATGLYVARILNDGAMSAPEKFSVVR